MTVKHLVLLELKDGVTDADVQEIMDGLYGLQGQIPGLLSVEAGRNFTDRAGNYDFAAVMTLEDKDALAGYGPHPAHQAAVGKLGAYADNLLVVDFEA
jgi:hypothetical protein